MEIKTKFNIGDTLFTIENMRITSFEIDTVGVFMTKKNVTVNYYSGVIPHKETECFPTKEALIDYISGK
ncbi:MAG: hypothetical protein HG422_08465 [Prevotella sp.]|nr:hypothetical protein [Prevotella sp.]